ncbi:MAG: hypothetical protein QXP81_09940 [Nitrososphaerota archaeon]
MGTEAKKFAGYIETTRSPKRAYEAGYKYCTNCRLFIRTDSKFCHICGRVLRNSPKKNKRIDPSKFIRAEDYFMEGSEV